MVSVLISHFTPEAIALIFTPVCSNPHFPSYLLAAWRCRSILTLELDSSALTLSPVIMGPPDQLQLSWGWTDALIGAWGSVRCCRSSHFLVSVFWLTVRLSCSFSGPVCLPVLWQGCVCCRCTCQHSMVMLWRVVLGSHVLTSRGRPPACSLPPGEGGDASKPRVPPESPQGCICLPKPNVLSLGQAGQAHPASTGQASILAPRSLWLAG